jgi:predicted nucleotidyltransferase
LCSNLVVLEDKSYILRLIKDSVKTTEPGATLILYGSYARGDNKLHSDIDLLILVDKEKITHTDEDRITFPLYDIEFETGTLISPMVCTKQAWASHRVTPFYEQVNREGKIL